MMRTPLLCCLAWSLVTGCTAQETDELAGEGEDGEAGKADGTGAFTYFQVAPDPGSPSGFVVSRPNRSTIKCGSATDAETRASCFARSISWSGTGVAAADATSYEERLRTGEPIILRGQLEAEPAADRDQRVSALASARLAGTATTELAASQPMVAAGGGPDCLYAHLNVSSVSIAKAAVTVDASAVSGTFDTIEIKATAKFSVTCLGGSGPVTIRIGRAVTEGESAVVTDVTIDAQLPQAVIDMLALNGRSGEVVVKTARALAQPIIDAEAASLTLAATEAWLPDDAATADADLDHVFVLAKTVATKVAEQRLNSVRAASVDTIDFVTSGASESSISAARDALAGEGVIIAGPRFSTDGTVGRHAERFWVRAAAE